MREDGSQRPVEAEMGAALAAAVVAAAVVLVKFSHLGRKENHDNYDRIVGIFRRCDCSEVP